MESTAIGLIAGINASRKLKGEGHISVPYETAHGSLIRYITTPVRDFQPSNINFGLFPPIDKGDIKKDQKRVLMIERALSRWEEYLKKVRYEGVYR